MRKDAKGNLVHVTVSRPRPRRLRLIGWTKTSVRGGRHRSRADVLREKRQPCRPRLKKIILADGSELHDTPLGGDEGGKTGTIPTPARRSNGRQTVRNSILGFTGRVAWRYSSAHAANPLPKPGSASAAKGFISEGIPRCRTHLVPAPKRDLSGAWVGPATTNKPDPVPPMTPAGKLVQARKA
jgi:hypothetical protein